MQKRLVLGLFVFLAACGNSFPVVRQQSSISTVTYPVAFGNYSRVYNTTYHIVNRYGVIKEASYQRGVIKAEIEQDTKLFDKTRRTILARIFDAGEYWDVETRVLVEVEDGDVETLRRHQPRWRWRTIAADQFLETRLQNEVKAALTGGAFQSKAPLKYRGAAALPAPKGIKFGSQRPSKKKPAKRSKDSRAAVPAPQRPDSTKEDAPHADRTVAYERVLKRGLNARQYERLGMRYCEDGKYQKAEMAFLAAIEAEIGNPLAPSLLAHARFAQGHYAQAAKALHTKGALKGSPTWEKARLDLRSFYKEPAQFQRQLAALEGHLSKSPKDIEARFVLGWVRYATGDFEGARDLLSLVSLAQPRDSAARHFLERSRIRVGLKAGKLREF